MPFFAAAFIVVALLTAASPAGAQPITSQALCGDLNTVCVYELEDYGGLYMPHTPVQSGSCWTLNWPARSIVNNSYVVQRVWEHSNCTGANVIIPTNSYHSQGWQFRALGGL